MKSTFIAKFISSAKEGPRLFFAPLIGAFNGVRDELRRIDEHNGTEMASPTLLKEAKMMLRAKETLLASGDWLNATELASIVGLSVKNPNAQLYRWKSDGAIFTIRHDGIDYFPGYALNPQDDFRPHPALKKVIEQFADTKDGWGLAFWFHSTNSFLGGKSPKELLMKQSERVVAAAVDEAAGVTHG